MTDEQWVAVKNKFATVLDTASKDSLTMIGGVTLASRCNNLFNNGAIGIDLIETDEYNYYKLEAPKMLFNADYVINVSESNFLEMFIIVAKAGGGEGELSQ
jgi:hypothetical protein